MPKIKILEVIRQGQVGGGETHVYDLSTRLDKSKFEPIVLSFTDGEMVDKLKEANIPVRVINSTKPFDPQVKNEVKKLIVDEKIELVHAHGTRAASNVLSVAKKLKIPVIYTVHGWSFNDNQNIIVRKLRKLAENYITRRTDLNICVSESNRSTGTENLSKFSATVINNGIQLDRFSPEIDGSSFALELQRSENEIWVGFLARLTFQKNPTLLLKAFQEASNIEKNLRLLMVGDGELKTTVQGNIRALNLEEKVRLLPFRRDIPEILKSIDIYCLPSLWEGHPIGLIEAMAMEKACIATNVDGSKEIINDQTGILIEKEDQKGLVQAILKLAKNPDLRKNCGKKAHELVTSKFSLVYMVSQIEKVYSEVKDSN